MTETKRNRVKRIAIEILNAKKFLVGNCIEGTWIDNRKREVTDSRNGELKPVTDLIIKTDTGRQYAIPQDAGLRVALSEYNAKQGDYVYITKKPQIKYNGNDLNQYEIEFGA